MLNFWPILRVHMLIGFMLIKKNVYGGVLLLVKLQASKVTLPNGCFSRFSNRTNGTKSHKTSYIPFNSDNQSTHYIYHYGTHCRVHTETNEQDHN